MMNQTGRLWIVGGIVAALSLCGCSTEYYRAETRLHSDGQVERAIYQPQEATPEEARQPKLWKETRGAEEIESGAWSGRISDVAAWMDDKPPEYFAAWNRFAAADKIPDHYIVQSSDEKRQSRLIRETTRVDLVFVTEHRWQETLTDIVTLDDMHVANRELAELHTSYVDDVLTAGLGKEYDHKPLIAWMRGEGKQWFIELTNAYYDAGTMGLMDGSKENGEKAKKRLEAVCARHQLKFLEQTAFREFATGKLRELVRRKDGRPLDGETIDSLLVWLVHLEVKDVHGKIKQSPLTEVAKKVVAAKYGGEEAYSRKTSSLAGRIWGLYGPMTTPRQFDYSLEMPGTIVETSGALQTDNLTKWSFQAAEAYPLGYKMTSRSLEPNAALIKKLLKGQPLKSRESLVSYAEIVADNDKLLAALKQCVKLNSMSPLENYRVKTEADEDPDSVATVKIKRLWKLLKLPD